MILRMTGLKLRLLNSRFHIFQKVATNKYKKNTESGSKGNNMHRGKKPGT